MLNGIFYFRMTMLRVLPVPKTSSSTEDDARLRKGEQTRELILEASAKLFTKTSVRGMAISDLVKETGIPASSIYWHFGSKDGLVCAVIETGARRLMEQFPDASGLQSASEADVGHAMAAFSNVLRNEFQFIKLLIKVGLEFSDEENEIVRIVRRAREETISYGVKSLMPAFHSMPAEDAAAAATRVLKQLMAIADGIIINISIEKDLAVANYAVGSLTEFIMLLVRRELAAYAQTR